MIDSTVVDAFVASHRALMLKHARAHVHAFGEAIPAQAIAQVCELTWQLRGQAQGRQVEGAKVGITANQGLFGHGSSVILSV